jgi:hypothetical protein
MSVSPAQARVNSGGTVVGGAVVSQAPGEYSFRQYNETVLQTKILDILEKRSQEDAEWVKSSVQSLNLSVKSLIDDQMKGGLSKLADQSLVNGMHGISLESFLSEKRNYEAAIETINAQINSISAIPSVMQPGTALQVQGSQAEAQKSVSRVMQIQSRFNVNLAPVIKNYEEQMTAIANKIKLLSFKVLCKDGALVDQVGLTLTDLKNHLYTASEKSAKRNEAMRLRVTSPRLDQALKSFNIFQLNNLNSAIESYGVKYRIQDTDTAGEQEALKMIEDIFFARSLLRLTYGMPLGAPRLNYDLKAFNWDFLSSSNKLVFSEVGVKDSASLMDMHNRMATSLDSQKARTVQVFSGNGSIMSMVTSSISFLKGDRARVVLNTVMLTNLVKDLEEEMKLAQPGGRRQLKSMVPARYFRTDADKARFQAEVKDLTGTGRDAYSNVQQAGVDTLPQMYTVISGQLKNYADQIKQAEAIEASLAVMDADINANTDTIIGDLLGSGK